MTEKLMELIGSEEREAERRIEYLKETIISQPCEEIIDTRMEIEWWRGYHSALLWVKRMIKKGKKGENDKHI